MLFFLFIPSFNAKNFKYDDQSNLLFLNKNKSLILQDTVQIAHEMDKTGLSSYIIGDFIDCPYQFKNYIPVPESYKLDKIDYRV